MVRLKRGRRWGTLAPFSREGPNSIDWETKASESSTPSPKLVNCIGKKEALCPPAEVSEQHMSGCSCEPLDWLDHTIKDREYRSNLGVIGALIPW
jgi:hypothetical protein